MKEDSPFTPGSPVPADLFIGREKTVKEILRYIGQTGSGKQENIFLAGDRGIGKSSLASFIRHLAVNEKNFIGTHVFLGGASTLEEVVRCALEHILKTSKTQNIYGKITDLFGDLRKYINEVGAFGISVSFNPPPEQLHHLVLNFADAISGILEKIKEEQKSGLILILDDINGLTETPDFANWYKSLTDHIATHYKDFPLLMILIGLPQLRDRLAEKQPSLMRIFRLVDIDRLSEGEVKQFFLNSFSKVNTKIQSDALDLMIKYSSGLPIFMQEIGDSIYWTDNDSFVDVKDAISGITVAANRIGAKYLDPKVYGAIRSKTYRAILRKLGEKIGKEKWADISNFKRKEIEKILDEEEKPNLDNFLKKMQDLGITIADLEGGVGAYTFTNQLYPIYIMIESLEHKKRVDGPLFEKVGKTSD